MCKPACKTLGCGMQLALCGQSPEVALSSALTSVQFYMTQQVLQADLQAARLHQKLDKMRAQCNARLQEVHDGYLKVLNSLFLTRTK
jgi:hypothetical protein